MNLDFIFYKALRKLNFLINKNKFSGLKDDIVRTLIFLRQQKALTRIFGPIYKPNHNRLEVNLTYHCNLGCYNCNTSCRQAPSNEHMTVERIEKFISESIACNRKWKQIRITGGEPTLHPQIFKVLQLLLEYKNNFSFNTRVVLITNGFGPEVNEILSKIPSQIEIENTKKESPVQNFRSFNIAPIDLVRYRYVDYVNGCHNLIRCGIGLTPHGFYPCSVGGGIDRVVGLDIGRRKLPAFGDDMSDQLHTLCRYCGYFRWHSFMTNREQMSYFWKRTYENFKKKKPHLTLY